MNRLFSEEKINEFYQSNKTLLIIILLLLQIVMDIVISSHKNKGVHFLIEASSFFIHLFLLGQRRSEMYFSERLFDYFR